MHNSVLNIVIEESLSIKNLNELTFLSMPRPNVHDRHKRVFKDYILSPESFPIDSHAN